jgi:hypothetical protein
MNTAGSNFTEELLGDLPAAPLTKEEVAIIDKALLSRRPVRSGLVARLAKHAMWLAQENDRLRVELVELRSQLEEKRVAGKQSHKAKDW